MCHKQQSQVAVLFAEALVVQRGYDSLTSSRGGYDKVPEPVVPIALHGELLQHLSLMRPRLDIEKEQWRLERVALLRPHRTIEPGPITPRFI